MFSLDGRKMLVTGATGGLGQSIAKDFHRQGATVTISGRRVDVLENLASDLGNERVHIVPCDLGDEASVKELVPKAYEAMDGLDTLVNNAGITKDGLMMRMKDEDFDAVIAVNLRAIFMLSRACLRNMMKDRFGRIINISSVVGVTGNPGQVNYCASKAGVIGMSKALAAEVATRGITVNCIAPGFIKSPMTDVLSDEYRAKLEATIPMQHIGLSEDISAAAVYISSKEAGYVTGQTLHINGGMVRI